MGCAEQPRNGSCAALQSKQLPTPAVTMVVAALPALMWLTLPGLAQLCGTHHGCRSVCRELRALTLHVASWMQTLLQASHAMLPLHAALGEVSRQGWPALWWRGLR